MLDAKHENGVELGFGTVIECLGVWPRDMVFIEQSLLHILKLIRNQSQITGYANAQHWQLVA